MGLRPRGTLVRGHAIAEYEVWPRRPDRSAGHFARRRCCVIRHTLRPHQIAAATPARYSFVTTAGWGSSDGACCERPSMHRCPESTSRENREPARQVTDGPSTAVRHRSASPPPYGDRRRGADVLVTAARRRRDGGRADHDGALTVDGQTRRSRPCRAPSPALWSPPGTPASTTSSRPPRTSRSRRHHDRAEPRPPAHRDDRRHRPGRSGPPRAPSTRRSPRSARRPRDGTVGDRGRDIPLDGLALTAETVHSVTLRRSAVPRPLAVTSAADTVADLLAGGA